MKKLLIILLAAGGFFAVAAPVHAATGTISGTVTYAGTSTPIASAFVYAQNVSTRAYLYAVAGDDGTYTVTSVPPGTYDVWCTGILSDTVTSFIKNVITVTVSSGAAVTGQDLAQTQRGKFIGHVYAADGVTPISGAALYLTNASGAANGAIYGVTTASDGSYVATPTPSDSTVSATGAYSFNVSRAGYFAVTVSGASLASDGTTVTQDITLVAGSTVSGTIRDASGVVSGAIVTLTKTGATFPSSYATTTDAAGAYTVSIYDTSVISGTAISDYTVSVSNSGYVTKTDILSITTESSTLTGQNYTLTAGKTFSGRVAVKSSNASLASAVVSIFKRNAARAALPSFTYTTGSDGAFSFTSLPVGRYRMTITRSGYVTLAVDAISITKDLTGQTYKLDATGSMTGLVYTGKSTGVESATVAVYALNNGKTVSYTTTTTNDTGHYTVNGLKAGTYRLKIVSADYVTQLLNVTIKAGKTATKNIKLASAGSIEGYVTDKETGLPIWGATVRILGVSISTTTDSNGYYVLDGIAPGSRKVTAVSALYDLPKQITLTVSAGKVKAGVNFSLKPKQ